jgi:hypothetical protein
MCFRLDSCFGGLSRQDYGRSTSKATSRGGGGGYHWGGQAGHAHGYDSGADQKAAAQAHHPPPADTDEAARNAGAGVRKQNYDDAGGYGGHTAYAQDKADHTLKHPATLNGKVGDDAGHTYRERLNDTAAYHREHAAADYHHYPTTTTTTFAR